MDPTLQTHLANLRLTIQGTSVTGIPVTMEQRIAAGEKYRIVMAEEEAKELRRLRQEKDFANEDAKLSQEQQRIDQESQRVQIAKVELVVRALEAASKNPELQSHLGLITQRLLA